MATAGKQASEKNAVDARANGLVEMQTPEA